MQAKNANHDYRPYTGIGSRKTPAHMLAHMEQLSRSLDQRGYTLRSGAADGADMAFESGAAMPEIYLPWARFNGSLSSRCYLPEQSFELASALHPAWGRLSTAAKKLMARNCQQILGERLDHPSLFVVVWTPDGCETHASRTSATGGTGQAISLASLHGIPVFNLAREGAIHRVKDFLNL